MKLPHHAMGMNPEFQYQLSTSPTAVYEQPPKPVNAAGRCPALPREAGLYPPRGRVCLHVGFSGGPARKCLLFEFPCQFLGRKYSGALNRVLSAAPAH